MAVVLNQVMKEGFNTLFNLLKTKVTLRTITEAWDSHDDFTPTTSDATQYCIMEFMNDGLAQEYGGDLKVGDIIVYFKPAITITENDKVQIYGGSEWYTMRRVFPEYGKDRTVIFYECWGRKSQ